MNNLLPIEAYFKERAGMRIVLVLALLAVLLAGSFMAPIALEAILVKETGLIERLTLVFYAAALLYLLIKGLYEPLKWIFWLTVLLMLRELDFDSRFTDMKITKTSFIFGPDIPIEQKVFGVTVLALVGWIVSKAAYTHLPALLSGLLARSKIAIAAVLAIAAAGLSKLVDGGRRKLDYAGIEITDQGATWLLLLEEILELGIPLLIIVGISYFADSQQGRQHRRAPTV